VVDLQLTRDEAVARFQAHQRQQLALLHASSLLKGASVRAALLPFWMFDVTVSSEARAVMGHHVDRWGRLGRRPADCTLAGRGPGRQAGRPGAPHCRRGPGPASVAEGPECAPRHLLQGQEGR
jgi:hypothetical protein